VVLVALIVTCHAHGAMASAAVLPVPTAPVGSLETGSAPGACYLINFILPPLLKDKVCSVLSYFQLCVSTNLVTISWTGILFP
jgi:hypothetical protein